MVRLMKDKKTQKHELKRPYSDINSIASSTECTGLTQFIPETEHEAESFKNLYDIPLSAEDVKETREREK